MRRRTKKRIIEKLKQEIIFKIKKYGIANIIFNDSLYPNLNDKNAINVNLKRDDFSLIYNIIDFTKLGLVCAKNSVPWSNKIESPSDAIVFKKDDLISAKIVQRTHNIVSPVNFMSIVIEIRRNDGSILSDRLCIESTVNIDITPERIKIYRNSKNIITVTNNKYRDNDLFKTFNVYDKSIESILNGLYTNNRESEALEVLSDMNLI